jgi:hypothetical protein
MKATDFIMAISAMLVSISSLYFTLDRFVKFITGDKPFRHVVIWVLVTVFITFSSLIFIAYLSQKKTVTIVDLTQQIEKLDVMQSSLTELQNFISEQKVKLVEMEKNLSSLKEEKQKLEPVVKSDRKQVESILQLQQDRSRTQVWRDRLYGFIIGFISSLLASSVIVFIKRRQ